MHIELAIARGARVAQGDPRGRAGAMLKRIGTAARARVEQMLGRQVHLKLWVRATPDWMNDPAKLRELGYGSD